MRFPRTFVCLFLLIGGAGFARADCQCFCVDGALRTLCGTLEEARQRPDQCAPRARGECPLIRNAPVPREYPPPREGARECRDVQVYDPGAGRHEGVKVCEVTPEA